MPHEVESMAYAGATPWHGLGTKVEGLMTAEEAIRAAGLDWTVGLHKVYFSHESRWMPVPKYSAIVRDTDHAVYGIAGSHYVPIQNREAFKFFDAVVGGGEAYYETAGSLKGGARIWILANLKGSLSVKGEEVKRYLTLTNSHDGYVACQMFWTPVRVVCMNTLTMALSRAAERFYARHTSGAGARIEEAKEILGMARIFYQEWGEIANAMADKQLPPAKMPLLLAAAFGTSGALDPQKIYKPTAIQMDKVRELVEVGRGMDNKAIQGTVWQAYNAVAEYADWYRPYRHETADVKLYGAWFGGGAEMKARAWQYCVKAL